MVVSRLRRKGVDQKTVDDTVVAQTLQKALCQIFLFHLNRNDDIVFAQGLDAVGDMSIQHTDIALRHLYALTVDYLGAVSGIHI